MKKALVLVLSLALALCLAIPALAADDVVIYDFSDAIDAEDTLGYNTGLPTYGVTQPVVTNKDGQAKIQFTGSSDTNWAVGGNFNVENRSWVGDFTTKAPDYKYIRLYVENNTPEVLPLTFIFKDATQKIGGSPDMTKAVLINTKGEKVTFEALNNNDSINGYIGLPSGFKGWLFMEADLATFGVGPKGYNLTVPKAWSEVSIIEWDMRDVKISEGNDYMIWDDLALVNEAKAPATSEPGTDKPGTDEPGNGGDISIMLYAAAAISGLGALAIRKKK